MPQPLSATYPDLRGRTVLISGGATGIGASLVQAFAAQGSIVAFIDFDEAAAESTARDCRSAGGNVVFKVCDVTKIDDFKTSLNAIQDEIGPIAVLINNAANDVRHDWRVVTETDWDQMIAVNLRHSFFAIQSLVPSMIEAGLGSVINMGSISWMVMSPNIPVYEAAKAAVHGLTRGLARDFGRSGVRINTVAPGWVMTSRQLKLWVTPETEAVREAAQAMRGRVEPEDVAALCLFLASDAARMISAQYFIVDGGWA